MIVTAAGDCGIDHYTQQKIYRLGGCSLNFAAHLLHSSYRPDQINVLGVIGNDLRSQSIEKYLMDNKIKNYLIKKRGTSPCQSIQLTTEGERTFTGYDEGVLDQFKIGSHQIEVLKSSDLVMTLVYRQNYPFFQSVMETPMRGQVAVDFMDLSDFEYQSQIVKKYIDRFDFGFFGLQPSQTQLISELESLAKNHRKKFIITLGSAGSIYVDCDQKIEQPVKIASQIVDTTGAGDSFAAIFLSEYLHHRKPSRALHVASTYASETISYLGAFRQ